MWRGRCGGVQAAVGLAASSCRPRLQLAAHRLGQHLRLESLERVEGSGVREGGARLDLVQALWGGLPHRGDGRGAGGEQAGQRGRGEGVRLRRCEVEDVQLSQVEERADLPHAEQVPDASEQPEEHHPSAGESDVQRHFGKETGDEEQGHEDRGELDVVLVRPLRAHVVLHLVGRQLQLLDLPVARVERRRLDPGADSLPRHGDD
mmetsp:Transcript_586/g.1725  ORF Transcript_586/g.1725 Transcript_586/m.1725 type:complete len:205 (+) Transcript_586:249-863(+)